MDNKLAILSLFLYDYKESDSEKHKEFTGVDNKIILENLCKLNQLQKDIILRCPIIPGYNDRTEHYDKIGELANALENIREIHIEPYHAFGEGKYAALGKTKPHIENIADEKTEEVIRYIQSKTDKTVKKA